MSTIRATIILAAWLTSGLSGCAEARGLRVFDSPHADLDVLGSRYYGRLAIQDSCLIIQDLTPEKKTYIPLFANAVSARVEGEGVTITNAQGSDLEIGDIVEGRGAPYPNDGEQPVGEIPDTTPCRGIPLQIGTMNRA